MKRIVILLFSILIIIFQNQTFAISKNSVDKKVLEFVKTHPVKSMIYGLWINGAPVTLEAVGESMTDVPATRAMHVRAGGITETMLTTILMRMNELGMIKLTDTIDTWYPQLPNAKRITVKMLANCTSGLQDYVYNSKFIDMAVNHPFKQWANEELLAYATMQPPDFEPGKGQHYTHTDYVILSSILSKVAQKPVHELFEFFILKKLQMHQTVFNSKTAEMPTPILHAFSQMRTIYEDSTFWSPSWTSGSGGIISTMNDLGKWGNAWLQGTLLTKKSNEQLRAPDTVGLGKNNKDVFFGMGFGSVNHWLMQNPRFGGYSGIFAILPERKIVFIAFNTLKENAGDANQSVALWKELASDLAPEYPIPQF